MRVRCVKCDYWDALTLGEEYEVIDCDLDSHYFSVINDNGKEEIYSSNKFEIVRTKKVKIFISQPMRDKEPKEIIQERNNAVAAIKDMFDEEIEVINSYFDYDPNKKPMHYMGKAISAMSEADACIFIGDWENYQGCKIEHECAEYYGYEIIYYME